MRNMCSLSQILAAILCSGVVAPTGCGPRHGVVAYVAVDQHYSEPALKAFEEETGIRVSVVYDVGAAKTTGLVNRLIAENLNRE